LPLGEGAFQIKTKEAKMAEDKSVRCSNFEQQAVGKSKKTTSFWEE
jgi:hypothetical protein